MPKKKTIIDVHEMSNAADDAAERVLTALDKAYIGAFDAAIDAVMTSDKAGENAKNAVKTLLFAGAKAGMTLQDHATECKAHSSWPTKDGQKVGQKLARKTPAGSLYHSLEGSYHRYLQSPDGVLIIQADENGNECLVRVGKQTLEPVATLQPEQVNQDNWLAILEVLTAEQYDRLRPNLEELGCPSHLLKKAA